MQMPSFWSEDPDVRREFELIMQFWARFDETGESGQTSREVLERLRSQVNDCFHRGPAGFNEARSLTAEAMALMLGDST
jgi:transcriptional regulator with XRE-family HTH domain